MNNNLEKNKQNLIEEIDRRIEDKIIEQTNAELLKKLINNADSLTEAINIAELGTTYKRTGLQFDKRLEKFDETIKYLEKNAELSFKTNDNNITHKLVVGDNYDALLNLLVEYKGKIDIIYIDPPYGKDSMGEFAQTNYENSITRDNLLSMLYPRLTIAKQLLSNDGVIFCSIDDRNQAYIKCLFDEIFGEAKFLFNIPRQTKKGGKTTNTIAKNNDYILAYTLSDEIIFSQEEKTDLDKYKYEDEFVETRGKYALSQTLDYSSLSYSKSMDYPLEYEGITLYAGSLKEKWEKRQKGDNKKSDWTWRWNKAAVEWGIKNQMFVLKNNRLYTKSYLYCRKAIKKNELEFIDSKKAYTTLSFIENSYSNDNGKKELASIFDDNNNTDVVFKNPKPTALISNLIKMVNDDSNITILDFFAGSGTTGQAVLELNKQDDGNRKFILVTNNEITDTTPNGVVNDVTSKRLKRVMTGKCYEGIDNFKWLEKNKIFGDNLEVYNINTVSPYEKQNGKTPFDVIDETLYGKEKMDVKSKIQWVCENFNITQKMIESDKDYKKRIGGDF